MNYASRENSYAVVKNSHLSIRHDEEEKMCTLVARSKKKVGSRGLTFGYVWVPVILMSTLKDIPVVNVGSTDNINSAATLLFALTVAPSLSQNNDKAFVALEGFQPLAVMLSTMLSVPVFLM